MDYTQFSQWVDEKRRKLKLPSDCRETTAPSARWKMGLYSWRFQWVLTFSTDRRYINIREHYGKIKKLALSERVHFSYHYGPIGPNTDLDEPDRFNSSDPVDIRIDDSGMPVHLHYQAPNPHYTQDQVVGLRLDWLDMFTFVRAIIKHRKTGKPLNRVLGFEIVESTD